MARTRIHNAQGRLAWRLLRGMLALDPADRVTAEDALGSAYLAGCDAGAAEEVADECAIYDDAEACRP